MTPKGVMKTQPKLETDEPTSVMTSSVPVRRGPTNGSTRLHGLLGFQLVEGENVGEYSSGPGGLSGGPTAGAAQRHVYG